MKNKKNISILFLAFLLSLIFSSKHLVVNAEDLNQSNSVDMIVSSNGTEVNPEASSPTRVWVEREFNVGVLPPSRRFYEHVFYGQLYRGWLTITNRGAGTYWMVYQGYLYKPGSPIPIPSRLSPISE